MKDENNTDLTEKKKFRVLPLFIGYIIAVIVLFIAMLIFGINLYIIVIILIFISLIFLGSIFKRRKQKSLYSQLYPEKSQDLSQRPKRKFELTIKAEKEPLEKKFREVNLDYTYRKSLINKCENCGMIITGYTTNCPGCGKAIETKGVITKCKNCGMTIPRSARKCPVCGARV